MLAATLDEEGIRTPQRELVPRPIGAGDDDATSRLAQLDDRDRLGLAAEVPHSRRRADLRQRARRAHLELVGVARVGAQERARGDIGVAQVRRSPGTVDEEGLVVEGREPGCPDSLRDLGADQARGRDRTV